MQRIRAQIFERNGNEEVKMLRIASDGDYLSLMMDGKEIDLPIKKLKMYL